MLEKNLNIKDTPEKSAILHKNIPEKSAPKKKAPAARVPKKDRIVKGKFRNYENPGMPIKFSFTDDEQPAKTYILHDGENYELPLNVVKHVNSTCCVQRHENAIDQQGKPHEKIGQIERRYGIENFDFS